MPLAERTATAEWHGNLTEGSGSIQEVTSGALSNLPVSWRARTEQAEGSTSPEELIAAAHAACYAMAFSNTLNRHGHPPESLSVTATITFDVGAGGAKITTSQLDVKGRVPGLSAEEFKTIAAEGEKGCPVSNALRGNVEISLNAELEA